MLKRLMLGIFVLLGVIYVASSPTHVSASTSVLSGNTALTPRVKSTPPQDLPLNTPLVFMGFSAKESFLGYLGLAVSLNWDYLYIEQEAGAAKEIYLEDAGDGKVYMKSGKADWPGYDYVAISTQGYLYLGLKDFATAFTVSGVNDTKNSNYRFYEFFDKDFKGVGVYGEFAAVGKGTTFTAWKLVPKSNLTQKLNNGQS